MSELYHIFSDGSCDLPPELVKEKNITVVPFYVTFDKEHYFKEIEEISVRDFYQQMVDNTKVFPMSSLPSTQDYVDAFLPIVKQKKPIICICISTKLSGSMQSAVSAKNIILEEFQDAEITVIDATVNTVLQGLYVLEAVRLRDSGVGYQETIKILEELKSTGRIFFTVGGMEYLVQGGRIGKVSAVAGSVLGIRPIITLMQGEIFPSGIGRSRKKTMEKTIDLLCNYLEEEKADINEYSLGIGYGYDYEEACQYRDRVLEVIDDKWGTIQLPVYQIGVTTGVHTGPHPIGLGIIKKAL